MSSNPPLTRTRSLRRPTPGTATDLSHKPTAPTTPSTTSTTARRNISPSRLPSLRPVTRSVSTATTAAAASATAAAAAAKDAPPAAATKDAPPRRARPVSGTHGRSTSVTSRTQPTTAGTTSRPQPAELVKPRYPPNASSSSAVPTKRPTSSGGLPSHTRTRSTTAAPARTQGHVRARSTVTTSSTGPLTAAPVLRPPSAGQTARPARPPSTDRPSRPPTAANPTANPPRLLQKKPAFSTLQQHYSPLRTTAPKPATASFLAPPSPSKLPANVALTAETARLQTALLQLHLLHRDAPATAADWRASAHARLADRHANLVVRHAASADAASAAAAAANARALHAWAVAAPPEHAVPALDAALDALPALDARHAALARRFAAWAALVPAHRDGLALQDGSDPVLVEPLDDAWKADAAAQTRRLDALLRPLRALPHFPAEHAASDPARALEACRALLADMLAELAVMEAVERAAVDREAAWIRRVNREDEDARREGPRAGAVWRVI